MSTLHRKRLHSLRGQSQARTAFTLVEVLVALAVMMLLLTIILVPVNMALDVFHIGKARNEVQQGNNLLLNQLAAELRQAVFVYPNEQMPGITDKAPYSTNNSSKPYRGTSVGPTDNTSRIDFILPARDTNGAAVLPLRASNYIVTYYARRMDTSKVFDTYSNPVVLWRAQYPYKEDTGGTAYAAYPTTPPNYVANTGSSRYSDWSNTRNAWLTQTNGEPNLAEFCNQPITSANAASHLQITPRDTVLVAANATATTPSYLPDSSFICDDTNADGKIDRVTINLNLAKYDAIGARSENQQLRLTRVVDLPNVK